MAKSKAMAVQKSDRPVQLEEDFMLSEGGGEAGVLAVAQGQRLNRLIELRYARPDTGAVYSAEQMAKARAEDPPEQCPPFLQKQCEAFHLGRWLPDGDGVTVSKVSEAALRVRFPPWLASAWAACRACAMSTSR